MDLDPETCYVAYRSHDLRFDGRFFIGVVTTRVYCRPICPVRMPRREHMRFFACAAAAEEQGFRPCRRCRPETAPGSAMWSGTSAVIARALRLIASGVLDCGSENDLAQNLGIGARHLRRLFLRHVGATPATVASTRRVHFARRLIDETHLPMADVARASGFGSQRQFNDAVSKTFGKTPTALRRAARIRPVESGDGLVLYLPYRPPLEWTRLLDYFAARAIPGVEVVDQDAYKRTVVVGDSPGVIEVRQATGGNRLEVRARIPPNVEWIRVVDHIRGLFDLDANPLAIANHLKHDRHLARFLRDFAGPRVPGAWDGFELAVRAVLGQQITVRGASALAGRLVRQLGTPLSRDHDVGLTHLFPEPAALADAKLDGLGLPRGRQDTLRELARAVRDGLQIDPAVDPEQTRGALKAIPGIGEWTSEYIALRALRDPDAFPAADLGLRRALAFDGRPLPTRSVEQLAERWRPWRAYAAVVLWASLGTSGIHSKPHQSNGVRGGQRSA